MKSQADNQTRPVFRSVTNEDDIPVLLSYAPGRSHLFRGRVLVGIGIACCGVASAAIAIRMFAVPRPRCTEGPAAYTQAELVPGSTLRRALDVYSHDVGRYPQRLADLLRPPEGLTERARWRGPYLDAESDIRDAWGREYCYRSLQSNSDADGTAPYVLWSLGSDGEDGTGDEIR